MRRWMVRRGDLFRRAVEVCALAVSMALAVVLAAGSATAQEAEDGPRLEELQRLDLPREIARAADVRWLGDGEVALGVVGPGVHAWRLGESGAALRVALEAPEADVFNIGGQVVVSSSPNERDYGRVAVSPRGIAFADQLAGIHMANEDGIDGPVEMEFVGDLDRRRSLTAAVGLVRNDAEAFAPYAAWLIEDGDSPRGLLPTRDGGRGLEVCADAELSVIRFLSMDRLLVIPGAEAGVFVYDTGGALLDSLDAATFFAESGCDVEPNEWGRSPLSDAYVRADWLGPRRIVDEVVADGAGNAYFFVRYGAEAHAADGQAAGETAPGEAAAAEAAAGEAAAGEVAAGEAAADVDWLPEFGRRAVAPDIAATLPNTDTDCPAPHCWEPPAPGRVPSAAANAYRWRPEPAWRDDESSPRRRSMHHVALRSGPGASRLNRPGPGFREPRRQRTQEPTVQSGRRTVVNVRGGAVTDRVVASVPPPSGRVCWDLVHARVDDLRAVTVRPCAIESEFADTRLRADLRGDRAVILLRGGALRGGDVRAAEAFEARIRPPAGAEG